MVLTQSQRQIISDTEAGLRSAASDALVDLRWPNNEIPFEVDYENMGSLHIELLEMALSNFNRKCCNCVKFR